MIGTAMPKSKRKAIKDLAQSKVVNIGDFRELSKVKEAQRLALISKDKKLATELSSLLGSKRELEVFDGRFSFEQKLKGQEWDVVLLDQRDLGEEALSLCEKLKRQGPLEETVMFILSDSSEKDLVRRGLEKGCDEWVTRFQDADGLVKLIDHYLN
jgi:DNA-binding response OmpR family regulator